MNYYNRQIKKEVQLENYFNKTSKDSAQDQFLCKAKLIWVQSFPSPKLVALPRLKSLVYPAINS